MGSVCLQKDKNEEPSVGVSGCKSILFPAIRPSPASQGDASSLHPGLLTFHTHPIFFLLSPSFPA